METDPHPLVTATWLTPTVRKEFEGSGSWDSTTWVDLMRVAVEAEPGAVAVVDEEASMSRAEVHEAARKVAAHLRRHGMQLGDVVTIVLPNWREFVVIHAAVGLAGGVVNPLLPKIGVPEMRHTLRTAGSRFVFAAAEHRGSSPLEIAREASTGLGQPVHLIAVRGGGSASLEGILEESWDETDLDFDAPIDPRAADTVTFTSGTESLPKGVVHSHQTTMFGLRAFNTQVLGLTASDVIFMPSPVSHASGLQWGLRTSIYLGAPLVLQDKWDADEALRTIDRHRCTFTLAATPFIVDLVSAHDRSDRSDSGSTLNHIATGGAPVPRFLIDQVRRGFGIKLLANFGASETYITASTGPNDSEENLTSDGSALPGVEVDIHDLEGNPVALGTEGEIVTRGPHVFLGYLGDPDLTRRTFRGEWYRFGDLGHIDSAGMLHVTGRIKDIVIRGGENISVREIEELLLTHPAIASVAVVGYPDARLGERCCAVIQPQPGAEPSLPAITEFLLGRGLAKYKLPERLMLTDSMPTTATGKIKKSELRQQLMDHG